MIKNIIGRNHKFIVYVLLKVLATLLGIVSTMIVVSKLSVANYGIYSVALVLVGFIATFGFSWTSSSMIYFGSKEYHKTGSLKNTFWARNYIIITTTLVITLLIFLFSRTINSYVGVHNIHLLLVLWMFSLVFEDYLVQYFLSRERQIFSSLIVVIPKLIYIFMIVLFDFSVMQLIYYNIISHAITIFFIFKVRKEDITFTKPDKQYLKKVLNFSLWQLFGFSGVYIINFGDIAVIKHFSSIENVAIYNAAYKLFITFQGISYLISNFYASKISKYIVKKDFNRLNYFYYKQRFLILSLAFIAHLILYIFAGYIVRFIYDERYLESILIFRILIFGSFMYYISVFYLIYMNLTDKYKVLQSLNILQAILNILLDVILINIFGIIGPAIATLLAIIFIQGGITIKYERKLYYEYNKR